MDKEMNIEEDLLKSMINFISIANKPGFFGNQGYKFTKSFSNATIIGEVMKYGTAQFN